MQLATEELVGVEGLLRWRTPDGELIPPNEFIPLAEELGLIETMGDWVVEEMMRQDRRWREAGIDLEMGFNLSPAAVLAARPRRAHPASRLETERDPGRVIVEITESSAMRDPDRAHAVLWDLHARGLRVAIDDFGTGYSSLSRLRHLPIDVLKIDRSFVSAVDTDPQAATIVSAFIQLGKGLGMTTLAEGIETEGEWRFLAERGCELGPGLLLQPPGARRRVCTARFAPPRRRPDRRRRTRSPAASPRPAVTAYRRACEPAPSAKASSFTESVIRDMTRLANLHGAINLGQGFPDFPAPRELKDAAARAIAEDHNQYPVTWGVPAFREAIAAPYARDYGMTVDPETEICVTCGSTEAMMATMLGVLDPGDEVVVFEPFYENYGPDAIITGAVPRLVRLRPPDWTFDEAELRAAFGPRTRAIVINTPNNPTGKVFTREELSAIAELCLEHDAVAITDEIYEHITYDGAEHVPHRDAARHGRAARSRSARSRRRTR